VTLLNLAKEEHREPGRDSGSGALHPNHLSGLEPRNVRGLDASTSDDVLVRRRPQEHHRHPVLVFHDGADRSRDLQALPLEALVGGDLVVSIGARELVGGQRLVRAFHRDPADLFTRIGCWLRGVASGESQQGRHGQKTSHLSSVFFLARFRQVFAGVDSPLAPARVP
jgi:hypothetical protein